jgi:hypothetical protein
MRGPLLLGLSVGLVRLLAACSGGASCQEVAACGGNIVGDWAIVSSCAGLIASASSAALKGFCSQASFDASGLDLEGTISFKADGTYTASTTLSGSVAEILPKSCLTVRGVTLTCAQLNQVLRSAQVSGTAQAPTPSFTCSDASGGGCACRTAVEQQNTTSSGRYGTSGTVLTQTRGATIDQSDYCLDGSGLHLAPHGGATTSGTGGLGVSGRIELKRK